MTSKYTEARFRELAEIGLIEDSGCKRNGQIVWVLTDLARHLVKTMGKEALKKIAEAGPRKPEAAS